MSRHAKLEARNPEFEAPASSSRLRSWDLALSRFRGLAAVAALAYSSSAAAQGCAMCYTTAAAARTAALHALRSGILILLFPPILIAVGIFVLALRSRERFGDENQEDLAPGGKWNGWPMPRPPRQITSLPRHDLASRRGDL